MKLKLIRDEDAESPNAWGPEEDFFLIANHRSFFVPPPDNKTRNFDVQAEIDDRKKTHWIFLLEAYIHSGVVLALAGEGNFPDRQWDVSLLGAVFADKKQWRLQSKAREAALSLITTWNQYLSGDVWGVVIEDDEGNELKSCWGFYGEDYARKEGEQMLKHCQEHAFDPKI